MSSRPSQSCPSTCRPGFARRHVVLLVGVLVAAALAGVGALVLGRAQVEGTTSKEKIASICRLADRQPTGAGDAIAAIAADPDPAVRQAVMVALARFVEPRYRPAVEKAAQDNDPLVRAAAVGTLGRYLDPPAAASLGRLADTDADESVRVAALAALGRANHAAAIRILIRVMESDAPAPFRRQALAALEKQLVIHFTDSPDPMQPEAWQKTLRSLHAMQAVALALKQTEPKGPKETP